MCIRDSHPYDPLKFFEGVEFSKLDPLFPKIGESANFKTSPIGREYDPLQRVKSLPQNPTEILREPASKIATIALTAIITQYSPINISGSF